MKSDQRQCLFRVFSRGSCVIGIILAGAGTQNLIASVITQWNFNQASASTVNNSPAPSTGSGAASLVGMGTPSATNGAQLIAVQGDGSLVSTNSSDSATLGTALGNNYEWRVRNNSQSGGNNGWSTTTSLLSGAGFTASTAGFNSVVVSFDALPTGGAPRFMQFEYTTDGSTYTPLAPTSGAPVVNGTLIDFGTTAANVGWVNGLTFDLSSVANVANNPNFGFEFLSSFDPITFTDANGNHPANTAFQRVDEANTTYTTSGNYRFDMVTIAGVAVPEPASCFLAGLSVLGLATLTRRMRKQV